MRSKHEEECDDRVMENAAMLLEQKTEQFSCENPLNFLRILYPCLTSHSNKHVSPMIPVYNTLQYL